MKNQQLMADIFEKGGLGELGLRRIIVLLGRKWEKVFRRNLSKIKKLPKIHVKKSIVINAPVEKIYAVVRDFKQWTIWSPWLIAEPDCKVTYSDDGMSYAWEGNVTEAGEMKIRSEVEGRKIDQDLAFLKPWKSLADVHFTFAEKGEGVEVSWVMDSSLPFFMFFLKGMMEAFFGMDYERGLQMLKDYVETGSVKSKLEFPGEEEYPGCDYVGVRTRCSITDMSGSVQRDMKKLCASGVEINTLTIEAKESAEQFIERSTFEDLHDAPGAPRTVDGKGFNLDYLTGLGVNWLWFQPVHPSAIDGREIDPATSNPYAPGSPYAVKNFFEINPWMSAEYDGVSDISSTANRAVAMASFVNFRRRRMRKASGSCWTHPSLIRPLVGEWMLVFSTASM